MKLSQCVCNKCYILYGKLEKKKRKLEYESRIRIEKKGKLCEGKGRNEWNIE